VKKEGLRGQRNGQSLQPRAEGEIQCSSRQITEESQGKEMTILSSRSAPELVEKSDGKGQRTDHVSGVTENRKGKGPLAGECSALRQMVCLMGGNSSTLGQYPL